jgi:hypothetical protein
LEETMAKDLTTKDRKRLSKKSFALPDKRKYPIPDKAHARNALARGAQNGTPAEQKKVRAAVKKRFPSIGKKKHKKPYAAPETRFARSESGAPSGQLRHRWPAV